MERINLDTELGIKGMFEFTVKDKDGNIKHVHELQENTITYAFFRYLCNHGTDNQGGTLYCGFDYSTSTPQLTDTMVDLYPNWVSTDNLNTNLSRNLRLNSTAVIQNHMKLDNTNRYVYYRRIVTYSNNTVAGPAKVVNQLGLYRHGTAGMLYTRAKLHRNGIPIEISLVPGDVITLTYYIYAAINCAAYPPNETIHEIAYDDTIKYDYKVNIVNQQSLAWDKGLQFNPSWSDWVGRNTWVQLAHSLNELSLALGNWATNHHMCTFVPNGPGNFTSMATNYRMTTSQAVSGTDDQWETLWEIRVPKEDRIKYYDQSNGTYYFGCLWVAAQWHVGGGYIGGPGYSFTRVDDPTKGLSIHEDYELILRFRHTFKLTTLTAPGLFD